MRDLHLNYSVIHAAAEPDYTERVPSPSIRSLTKSFKQTLI